MRSKDRGHNFWDASLRPPVHPDDAGAPGSWSMLDVRAYIADRRNATTAYSRMRNGGEIQVTFCVAPPPVVSYFCVWCPEATLLAEIGTEPRIIAAEADLAVLGIPYGTGLMSEDPNNREFFVYHAGGGEKGPSLRRIEHDPYNPYCFFKSIGILRYRDDSIPHNDEYLIVLLTHSKLRWQFNLHIFDSKTEDWSSRLVSVQGREHQHRQFCHFVHKVIMLGEGSLVAFVDLWRGILVCDVLDPVALHYHPFPRSLKDNKKLRREPAIYRDVVVAQGRFKAIDCFYCYASGVWKASVWSKAAASLEKNWDRDYLFQMDSNLVDKNTRNFELLSKLQADDGSSPQKMLEALLIAHPILSLDNCHDVYFMAKINPCDSRAWVLAVDLKNKRIRDVGVFPADRTIDITLSYIHSRISKYFSAAPGVKVDLKRQGMFLRGRPCKKQARAPTEDDVVRVQSDAVLSMGYEDHMDLD